VIGVQDEEHVQGLLGDRVDLVGLRRRAYIMYSMLPTKLRSLRGCMNGSPIECL
jgi:hypothetical protein